MANSSSRNGQFLAKLTMFDGKNYDCWIAQIKAIFRYQDELEVLRDGIVVIDVNETLVTNRDQMKKDCKALFLIHQCVDADLFKKIVQFETMKEAWDVITNAYTSDDKLKKVKLQPLRRQYKLL